MLDKKTQQGIRASELIVKYLRGQISSDEQLELEQWVSETEGSSRFMQEVTDAEMLSHGTTALSKVDTEAKWEQLLDKVIAKETTNKKKLSRATWLSAAAVLLIALVSWAILANIGKQDAPTVYAGNETAFSKYGEDVLPLRAGAVLLSSHGDAVQLDADRDSSFAWGGKKVSILGNTLLYGTEGSGEGREWNTLRTGAGSEYAVTLSDGTKVWLNAASSIRYPVRFNGKERRVELVGEAYFEVAKDKEKPFIVAANKMDVQAVGTAFNVNSYDNPDSATVTTLEEGLIRVTTAFSTVMVKPSQQVRTDLKATAVSKADVAAATSWKHGLFLFNNAPLQEVTQQLSRWYDIKVVFDSGFKDAKYFTGEIKRNVALSKLLQMLELTGIASFHIEKHTLTVLPYKK